MHTKPVHVLPEEILRDAVEQMALHLWRSQKVIELKSTTVPRKVTDGVDSDFATMLELEDRIRDESAVQAAELLEKTILRILEIRQRIAQLLDTLTVESERVHRDMSHKLMQQPGLSRKSPHDVVSLFTDIECKERDELKANFSQYLRESFSTLKLKPSTIDTFVEYFAFPYS